MPASLKIVLYSGAFDRIHYALMMASAAAAINQKVTVLVTMAACHAFTPDGLDKLVLSDGVAAMPIKTPHGLDQYYQQQGIASLQDLKDACKALGVDFLVCEMGLRAVGLSIMALDPRLGFQVAGLVTLLHRSTEDKDSKLLFI